MTDIVARLRSRSSYLKDSAAERDMEEAAAEIERLRNERQNCPPASESEYVRRLEDEQRLRLTPEEAYLRVVEGWLRENRGIHFVDGAVCDLCKRIARFTQEPKP
jgi:hypothetical protein